MVFIDILLIRTFYHQSKHGYQEIYSRSGLQRTCMRHISDWLAKGVCDIDIGKGMNALKSNTCPARPRAHQIRTSFNDKTSEFK